MPRTPHASPTGAQTPRDPTTVKHGCVSCVHYPLPNTSPPCKSCERWSLWVDKNPERAH